MTSLAQNGTESSDPAWFQTTNKKVVSNHLSLKKRLGFQLSAVAGKKDSKTNNSDPTKSVSQSEFNVVSFGTKSHKNSIAGADTLLMLQNGDDTVLETDDIPLYNNSEDLPPARSLYDLNDEVMISLNRPVQHTESFINKDPRKYVNVFSKEELPTKLEEEKNSLKNSLLNSEAAVLVFGYPEHMANQVIARFLELGTVLEKFEAAKESGSTTRHTLSTFAGSFPQAMEASKNDSRVVPIFSGHSWVKITYDNPASALDALQESGSVFNGVLIGVIPYTKEAVEKLLKRKLALLEDIGSGVSAFSNTANPKGDNGILGDKSELQSAYSKRLDIKDGSGLFLTSQNNNTTAAKGDPKANQNLGLWGSISNYLFGFHDL
ncbi:hypothetical protein PUMCH_001818 [Australozyma saopauloensis]|uniref:RRM Nup35-type domain-containing protein n=1 Tax=Australozyma saopauloensis TaxID=291208 RepID=A0AAX4HA07_9ASCO|nr:hypothetical protein PUMCH_001818 [[Candida] saopauloensis]